MKKIILFCLFLVFTTTNMFAIKIIDIMKKMEAIQGMTSDITAKAKITQQKTDQGVKVIESLYYRKDSTDSFLVVMLAPDTDKGNGYLRVGDNMWMYRKNTRTFQIIKRDETIGGTNSTAGDFEKKKFTEMYAPTLDSNGKESLSEETLGKANIPVYKFKVTATSADITNPVAIYWVQKSDYLPLKVEYYSLSGTLMNTIYFLKYTEIEGKFIPLQQMVVDEFEKGNKTIMELSGISLKPIDSSVFTKPYLENLSK